MVSCKSLNYNVGYSEKKLPKNLEHVQSKFLNKIHQQWDIEFEYSFNKTKILIYADNKIIANDTITTNENWSLAATYHIPKNLKKIKVVIDKKTLFIPLKKEYPFVYISKKRDDIYVEYAKSLKLRL